jgi:C4-dicarboxylate transporter DctQ subunit
MKGCNPGRFFGAALKVLTLIGENFAKMCLYTMIVLIAVDVFGRYLLGSPLKFTDEVSGYLLVGLTFFGATHTFQKGMHIRVDVLLKRFSKKVQKRITLVMDTAGLLFVIIILVQSFRSATESLEVGSRSATTLRTPMFWPQILVPIGLAIFAALIVCDLVRQFKTISKECG